MLPTADTAAAPMAPPAARDTSDQVAGSVRFLPVEALRTSYARLRPGALRVRPDDTAELPLRVAPRPDGAYEVLDGLKRLARWQESGHRVVPVVVEPPGDAPAHKRRLLCANNPPRTTTALDEAEVVCSLLDEDGFTPERVERYLGHGADWVARRETIGRRLGPEGRKKLAAGLIGATFAHALCALPKKDQDALVGAASRHGLGARDAVVLVSAYRTADETDRKALLAAPMDAVRPQAPSPTLTPRAVTLERRLVGFAESLRDLARFTLPDDLAPAERRRLEAVRRGVLTELERTARALLPQPTTQEEDHVRRETEDSAQAPGTPSRRAARRGDPGRDPQAPRPGARHPEDPGPPPDLPAGREGGARAGGTTRGDGGDAGGGEKAPPVPRRDREAGGPGPHDLAHPPRDQGAGLPGRPDDPRQLRAPAPSEARPRAPKGCQAPVRDGPRPGDAD
jgi:ParB-like chromosome segregation protein Spo0J